MQTKPVVFVTGNANKLKEVQHILAGIATVSSLVVNLPELQGDPKDISSEKCKIAVKEIEKDELLCSKYKNAIVVIEDTCLCFNALKGLPGPYIKWFLEKLGHEGLNQLIDGFEDKSAYALTTLAFFDMETREMKLLEGRTEGKIVMPRGVHLAGSFGWTPIFEVAEIGSKAFGKTYAELDNETKNSVSQRYKAFSQLKQYLL